MIESIGRAQQRLQGETPLASQLWDNTRPKGEIEVAKFLADHFRQDLESHGIIVNREVEVQWQKRTDIQIEAVAKQQRGSGFDRLRVITEVKGCWNPELPTGLQKQLVQRYLERLQTRHGIYLLADFQCAFWDDSDPRKKKAKALSTSLPTLRTEIEKLRREQWHIEMPIIDFTRPTSAKGTSRRRRAASKKRRGSGRRR